jgi:hypothetical protein
MKRIILLVIFAFSISISRTLLVPEEFLTIQSAVITASEGDTVSVNFGRPNGKRSAVSSQRIIGKDITFEVRGEEKNRLLGILKSDNKLPTVFSDSGWTRQSLVNRLDSTSDQQSHIAIDNLNQPWVVWMGSFVDSLSYDLLYTKWNGMNWNNERGIIPYNPGQGPYHLRPRIIFDNLNRAWVVYDKFYPNDTDDIFFTRWNGEAWEQERQLNLPGSVNYNFAPRIACGGGQIWCCWYGNNITNRYKIYVSRWNGNNWENETQISPQDTCINWFCDIAVDNLGRPHVVWGNISLNPGIVYYRTYNGTTWLAPETLNNPEEISAADWTGTSISIDSEGYINVAWAGIAAGQNQQDIFFSRKINGTWLVPIRINTTDTYDDCYPSIISKEPNNIWVGWSKIISFWEIYTFVSKFNGDSWSTEKRLDDRSISYCNGTPQMVFRSDEVWAVWDGFTVGIDNMDIYYSRYLNSSISEIQSSMLSVTYFVISPNPFGNKVTFSYKKDSRSHTFLAIYDLKGCLVRTLINREEGIGDHHVNWRIYDDNKKVSNGVYFVLLKSEEKCVLKKIIKNGG